MTLQVSDAAKRNLAALISGLRSKRIDAGISQVVLSRGLPVRGKAVSDWETGWNEPTWENLIQWSRKLKLRLVVVDENGGIPYGPLRRRADESWLSLERRRLTEPLWERRLALDLRQADVGQLVGVSRDSIQRWELVHVPPKSIAHIMWAHQLGCSVELWSLNRCPERAYGNPLLRELSRKASSGGGKHARLGTEPSRAWNRIREQLWAARIASGLSQEQCAAQVGVSARSLRDWEKGYDRPSSVHLVAWARVLDFRLVVAESAGVLRQLATNAVEGESFERSELRRLVAPLRVRRRERGLSQTDMGLLLGVDRRTMGSWETAMYPPTVAFLIAYAGRVGCRLQLQPIESCGGRL